MKKKIEKYKKKAAFIDNGEEDDVMIIIKNQLFTLLFLIIQCKTIFLISYCKKKYIYI